jgi:hypothetical protein
MHDAKPYAMIWGQSIAEKIRVQQFSPAQTQPDSGQFCFYVACIKTYLTCLKGGVSMKWKNLALMVLMSSALVACGGSGGSSDSEPVIDDPTPPVAIVETLRIADVEPSAAVAGDEVIVTYEGEGTPQIVLGGSNVVGTPAGSGSISFIVPVGAETGPLYIKVADLVSNRILFSISSASVVTPTAEDIVIDEDGNSVAVNQVLVSLFEEFDSLAEAYRIASLVGGTVVGQIPLLYA